MTPPGGWLLVLASYGFTLSSGVAVDEHAPDALASDAPSASPVAPGALPAPVPTPAPAPVAPAPAPAKPPPPNAAPNQVSPSAAPNPNREESPPAPPPVAPPAPAPSPAAETTPVPDAAPPFVGPQIGSTPTTTPVLDDSAARAPAPGENTFPLRDFDLEVGFGLNGRLSSAAGYSTGQSLGSNLALAGWFNLERVSLGLEISRTDLGRASERNGQNYVNADYSEVAAWLGGRFVPWQHGALRPFLALKIGLALEHVAASGARELTTPLFPATAFNCGATQGPALAFGGALGLIFHLNSRLDFVSQAGAHAEQLTSSKLGGCATGIGSTTSLGVGIGVAYGFDGPTYNGDPLASAARPEQARRAVEHAAQTW